MVGNAAGLDPAIPIGRVGIEAIGAQPITDHHRGAVSIALDGGRLPAVHRDRALANTDLGFAFADDQRRVRGFGIGVEAVGARADDIDLRVRRVEFRALAGVDRPQTKIRAAIGEERRELSVVELGEVDVRFVCEPQLSGAEVDLCPTFSADPEVVAHRYRIVDADLLPSGFRIVRREEHAASDVRKSSYARRWVQLRLRDCQPGDEQQAEDGQEERREWPQLDRLMRDRGRGCRVCDHDDSCFLSGPFMVNV